MDGHKFYQAKEAIHTRYDRLIQPYRATQARNQNVVLKEIVALEIECDEELQHLYRASYEVQAYESSHASADALATARSARKR